MLYFCPHRGITTDDRFQLCPECHGLVDAVEANRRVAKISVEGWRLKYSDGWPDELPLDYRMDVK